ncbi:DUF4870 domain-containing protein [Bacillus tianshenii]|nr:DUF4870 domain-containing protein [Bacillus tianshenii]
MKEQLSSSERTWALIAHLASFAGYVLPLFGNIIGPVIVYALKKDDSAFVADQARESINFQISFVIYSVIAGILLVVLVGIILLAILPILQLIFVVIASVKASDGQYYRYPMTIRFLK